MNKLKLIKDEMSKYLIDRDVEIDLILLGMLTKLNVMLIGSPGGGKTMLAEAIIRYIVACRYFYAQGHAFLKPEELIGPVDIGELNNGKMKRVIDGFLPTCHIALLDEITRVKAAKSILLSFMNERRIKIGSDMIQCPVEMVVLAANHEITEDEDQAFLHRISFKAKPESFHEVEERFNFLKQASNIRALSKANPVTTITLDELHQMQNDVMNIQVPDDVLRCATEIMHDVQDACDSEINNRTMMWCELGIKADTFLHGQTVPQLENCSVLSHMLWARYEHAHTVKKIVNERCNSQVNAILNRLDEVQMQFNSIDPGMRKHQYDPILKKIRDERELLKNLNVSERNKPELNRVLAKVVKILGEASKKYTQAPA